MVVAATLRCLLSGNFCCRNYKLVSVNPFYEPSNKEYRQEVRKREWYIWVSSISDDLDLIGDWWYFQRIWEAKGSFTADLPTTLMGAFTIAATITWLLEILHVAILRPKTNWTWLPLLIVMVEDIPIVILTYIINGRFNNPSPLALFNIMTSLYSLMIRVAGQIFTNCCYGCEPAADSGDEEARNYYRARTE